METVAHIGVVKYIPLIFRHGHPNYQGLVFPRIGLEQKTTQNLFSQNTYIYKKILAGNGIRPNLK